MKHRRALLIVNPKSRRGNSSLASGIDFLTRNGFTLLEKQAVTKAEIGELISRNASNVDCVILGGGDGTLNAATHALRDTKLPFGVLPLGTANDFARTLQIPLDLQAACNVIAKGRIHPVDLGCVNDICFLNVAHLGLAVRVTEHLSPQIKARWGAFSYALALFRAFQERRSFSATIQHDGCWHRVRSLQISVGNGRHYGGGMTVAEAASIDDHLLHLYSVKPLTLGQLVRLMAALRKGPEPQHPGLHLYESQEFRIETSSPMKVQTDGELTTETPAHFRVLPAALNAFVPEHYESPGNTP